MSGIYGPRTLPAGQVLSSEDAHEVHIKQALAVLSLEDTVCGTQGSLPV